MMETNTIKKIIKDKDSFRSFTNFLRDINSNKITLVCGAGISVSAGLPTWNVFLTRIVNAFLQHWKELEKQNNIFRDLAPNKMSINLFEDELQEYLYEAIPESLSENFLREDPLILAQLIKNCIEPNNWKYLLKKSLYGSGEKQEYKSETLDLVSKLIENNSGIISSVMTYNYDDLIELNLKRLKFKTSVVVAENHLHNNKYYPIYHLHGVIPFKGGIDSKIYLSEEDYLTDIVEPNSWYNQIHANKLTSTCCLFLGLSFNDPSIKRKIAIHRLDTKKYHYALLTHKDNEFDKKKFLLLKNELLRLNVRVIKYEYSNGSNPHENLQKILELIANLLSQTTHTYRPDGADLQSVPN